MCFLLNSVTVMWNVIHEGIHFSLWSLPQNLQKLCVGWRKWTAIALALLNLSKKLNVWQAHSKGGICLLGILHITRSLFWKIWNKFPLHVYDLEITVTLVLLLNALQALCAAVGCDRHKYTYCAYCQREGHVQVNLYPSTSCPVPWASAKLQWPHSLGIWVIQGQ